MPQEVEPGHHGIIRVRAFVDFWNFQLSLNAKHGGNFHVDWQRMGPWLADNAKQLIFPEGVGGDIRYDGLNVYLSYDPSADGAFRNWATNVLDRFAGVQVVAKERKPKGPPKCSACHEKILKCPHCGSRIKSKVEKGIDTAIVTDMIRLAWEDAYDVAVIVSSDRDFIPAVEFLSQKGLRIIHAAFPPIGMELSRKCWASFSIADKIEAIRRK